MKQKSAVTEKQVRDLAAQGLAQHEIAKRLGCAQGTVAYIVKRHNIAVVDGRSSKNHAPKVYDSVEAQNMRIQEIVQAAGVTPATVQTLRMTPFQALDAKLKWPWIDKVQQLTPNDLNPNFYDKLIAYHPFDADEVAWMFGFKSLEAFGVWLKKWGYSEPSKDPTKMSATKPGIETNLAPSAQDVEAFFEQAKASGHDLDQDIDHSDDQWESVLPPIRLQEVPLLSVCKSGCYITKAAVNLLKDLTEIECQVRQDGRMVRIGRGGNIRLNKTRDTICSDRLKTMIEQKNIALPARYLLAWQGNWLVGKLEG